MSTVGTSDPGPGQNIYHQLIANVQDYAILLLDTDGTIKTWNKGAEMIKGYKESEIIGRSFEIFYTEEERKQNIPQSYLLAAAEKGHIQQEGWRVRKDGSRFWANVTITALYNQDSTLQGFSKVTSDQTEKIKIRAEKDKIHEIQNIINQTTRIGTWEVDLINNVTTWSAMTREIHEVDASYVPQIESGLNFYKEGESRDIITHVLSEAMTHCTPYDIEVQIVTPQGREKWCRVIGHTEFRDGKCIRVFGTFQDIDLQKRTQIELQLSEQQFRSSFDLSGIGMALVSTDAVPIRVNKRLCDILGYTFQEFYSMSILDITYADDIATDTSYATQLLSGEIDHYQMTKRYIHKNGSIVWAHITVSLVRDAQKNPVHFVSEVEDISEKKKAEDELRRTNAELTAMFNSGARVSIVSADLKGIITHFNKGAEAMLGYTADELIGKASPQILHLPAELQEHREKLVQTLGKDIQGTDILREKARQDGYDSDEWTYVRKDGTTLPVQLVVSSIKDEQGQITGYLGIATDITQIKEAEASIRKYALLEMKNKEMEQFTFIASHDLLEPLQTLSSFVGLLSEEYHDTLDENAVKYIHFISDSARRMMDLVRGLLHYSRIGRERISEKVNCNEIIKNVLDDLGLLISDSKTDITVGDLPVLNAYPLEMTQLFQSLITNAIKFCRPDVPPKISISASRKKNKWTFVVTDNGIGIAERSKEKVFVIFQRLHDRHEYDGMGIGLAYCRKIVELHNGTIWIESTPGEGSSFYFTIMT
jgi:PAS domain S-box-containing protein